MRIRSLLLVSCGLIVAGCFSPGKVTFVDLPSHAGKPTVTEITAKGDRLQISVVQDQNGVWIGAINAVVIKGDVYLHTQFISSPVHGTGFGVDLSGDQFPRDWKDRLYWIEQDSISSPINPFIGHSREIQRSKIMVK